LFLEVKGRKIPINIDGLIAVLLCDFGFDALLGKGIFIIGRVPGLVAQCFEELKFEKPVRRLDEDDIEYLGWFWLVIVTQFTVGNNKTSGKFILVKEFSDEDKEIITKAFVFDEEVDRILKGN